MKIVFFGPVLWSNIKEIGFRKTSGAMLKSILERSDIEHVWYVQHERRWGIFVRKEYVNSKLTIVGLPIGLPYERLTLVRWLNRQLQAWLLKRTILAQTDVKKTIYWFYDWWNVELIFRLPRAYTIMEITDLASDFISKDTAQQWHFEQVKKQALELVDLIIPVSAPLAAECLEARGKVMILPNAIGRDFLDQARKPQLEPDELKGIKHPRLCVVSTGWSLNYRLDHNLLMKSLEMLDGWQLILIGCERIESPALRELIKHPRVKAIGLVPLRALPAFIQSCDVCAAPYPRNVSKAGDSLKVYEYLACGKPVVLSSIQGNPQLQEYLRFAFDAKQFTKACQELLHSTIVQNNNLDKLLDIMTWENRVQICFSAVKDAFAL